MTHKKADIKLQKASPNSIPSPSASIPSAVLSLHQTSPHRRPQPFSFSSSVWELVVEVVFFDRGAKERSAETGSVLYEGMGSTSLYFVAGHEEMLGVASKTGHITLEKTPTIAGLACRV